MSCVTSIQELIKFHIRNFGSKISDLDEVNMLNVSSPKEKSTREVKTDKDSRMNTTEGGITYTEHSFLGNKHKIRDCPKNRDNSRGDRVRRSRSRFI